MPDVTFGADTKQPQPTPGGKGPRRSSVYSEKLARRFPSLTRSLKRVSKASAFGSSQISSDHFVEIQPTPVAGPAVVSSGESPTIELSDPAPRALEALLAEVHAQLSSALARCTQLEVRRVRGRCATHPPATHPPNLLAPPEQHAASHPVLHAMSLSSIATPSDPSHRLPSQTEAAQQRSAAQAASEHIARLEAQLSAQQATQLTTSAAALAAGPAASGPSTVTSSSPTADETTADEVEDAKLIDDAASYPGLPAAALPALLAGLHAHLAPSPAPAAADPNPEAAQAHLTAALSTGALSTGAWFVGSTGPSPTIVGSNSKPKAPAISPGRMSPSAKSPSPPEQPPKSSSHAISPTVSPAISPAAAQPATPELTAALSAGALSTSAWFGGSDATWVNLVTPEAAAVAGDIGASGSAEVMSSAAVSSGDGRKESGGGCIVA